MSDKFATVRPGQRFRPSAATWNALIEAAKDREQKRFKFGGDVAEGIAWGQEAIVKNVSGQTLDRFAVVGLGDALIKPADAEAEFLSRPMFAVGPPAEDARGQWGILQEPLPPNRFGRAWVDGVMPAKVLVEDEDHGFADADGETAWLVSGCSGAARILWAEHGEGLSWAVIRLGVPSEGTHVRFGLLESLSSGAAMAELIEMDGTPVGDELVRDPEGIFERLDEGDRGIAVKRCGKFWVIQAKCPTGDGG